ncbi:hypothetical protein HYX02_06935 [Candidatus Woesearchaeota archaeon]|nr:hypothetical protein [Candidatus Woesearchaeota archaeon]
MTEHKTQKAELWMFLIAVIVLGIGMYYLGPSITGFVINDIGHSEQLNLVVASSGNYTWELEEIGDLKSVKIDGKVTKYGRAKVYIESNGIRHLVFDSTRIGESKENNASNESILITGFAVKDNENETNKTDTDEDKKIKNHKPDWTSGADEFVINGTATINLSEHFTDEDNNSLIFSVSQVDGLETAISNETITITSKNGNDFNTTITFTASDGIDTKSETVKLIAIVEKKQVAANREPLWNSSIDVFVVNGTTTINLSQFFIDEDHDTLTYTAALVDNISVTVDNSLITLVPADAFFGNATTSFTAFDSKNTTIKIVTLAVPERIIVNETPTLNETNLTNINKTITINLNYKKGTIYDGNDNGEESVNGVVDLTVESTSFNWNADESRLCTRWEVYNIEKEQLTTFCNGHEDCCAFFSLLPTKGNWSETYYAVFEKDGTGYNNIVSAQVLYYDVNLSIESPKSEIYYSEWGNKGVKFFEEEIKFSDECIETCTLSGLNKSTHTLIFEIEDDAVLWIDTIKYNLLADIGNNPPVLLQNFSIVNVQKNGNATINLSKYFADPDGDKMTYSYYKPDNITMLFENDIATIVPDKYADGVRYTYMVANDSEYAAISNLFVINISEMEEAVELKFFEIRDSSDRKLAVFDSLGNLRIKGVLIQNIEPVADENDFVLQDNFGNLSFVVKNPEGDLMMKGNLIEYRQALTPTPNSFIIQDYKNETVAYFNSTGSLFLKGILREGFLFE